MYHEGILSSSEVQDQSLMVLRDNIITNIYLCKRRVYDSEGKELWISADCVGGKMNGK